jgi:divinyl protochlorophyllide a 8-vinyl-reductase
MAVPESLLPPCAPQRAVTESRSLPEAAPAPRETLSETGAYCAPVPAARPAATIGPNALIQAAEALGAEMGAGPAMLLFVGAGLGHRFVEPPADMVPEGEAIALHAHLRASLGSAAAERVAADAGRRTADYLLAHRIPRTAQAVLKRLPARLAARLLLKAIGGHAWTFAGSGRFSYSVPRRGPLTRFEIADSPLCRGQRAERPLCGYYAATFQRLFRVLVHPNAVVTETACGGQGAPACRFLVRR